MTDLRVIVTVKNAVLLRAMEAAGFDSNAALSRACGTSETDISAYLNLRLAPFNGAGELRPSIQRIAKALGQLPEDLFPAPFLHRALERNRVQRDVSSADLPAILGHDDPSIAYSPERTMIVDEALAALDAALSEIKPRERRVLALRFGLDGNEKHTLEQTAKIIGTTRERVRQIELRAQRRLRHPSRDLRARAAALLDAPA